MYATTNHHKLLELTPIGPVCINHIYFLELSYDFIIIVSEGIYGMITSSVTSISSNRKGVCFVVDDEIKVLYKGLLLIGLTNDELSDVIGKICGFPFGRLPYYAVVVLQEGVYTMFTAMQRGVVTLSKIDKEGISIVINYYYYTLRKFN